MKYKLNHKFSLSGIRVLDYVYDEQSLDEALHSCTNNLDLGKVYYPSDKELVAMKQKSKATTEVLYLVNKGDKVLLVTESELEDLNKQTSYLYQANYNNLINTSIYNIQRNSTPQDLEIESRTRFRDRIKEHFWSDLLRTVVIILGIIGSIKLISIEPIVGVVLLLLNTPIIVLWRVSIYSAFMVIFGGIIDYYWSAWNPNRFDYKSDGGTGGIMLGPGSLSGLLVTRLILLLVSILLIIIGAAVHISDGFHENKELMYWSIVIPVSILSSLPIVLLRILVKRK